MKHHTTIDDVARLINAGATGVTSDIGEVKQDRAEVTQRFHGIQRLLLAKQEQRHNELEARMNKLEDAPAV